MKKEEAGLRSADGPPERWLIVAHEASNSGAPRMLLEVLQGVQVARPGWSCEFLFRHGGDRLAAFAKLGTVHVLAHPLAEGRSWPARLYRRFIDHPWRQRVRLRRWMRARASAHFDLIYSNTTTNGFVLAAVRSFGCPILTHVHELATGMRRFNSSADLAHTLGLSRHFIAVSAPAAEDLQTFGVPIDRISVVPNFLAAFPPAPVLRSPVAWRRQLGLRDDGLLVVGCGHLDRIKGPDLFLELAATVAADFPAGALTWVWVGGIVDRALARRLRADVRRRGLQDTVRFVGSQPEAAPWFGASDVVVVTSRAESFSLVALEAAALARPVAGFAGARGLRTMLEDIPGLLAPDHDVGALADIVMGWLRSPQHAKEVGLQLRASVAAKCDAASCIQKILAIADRLRGVEN